MKNLDQLAQIAGGGQGIADYYLWYNCTLAMSQAGGEPWRQWNVAVRDLVTGLQEHDGCRRGSWSHEDDVYGTVGGRVYSTALAALTLQSYYRFVTK